jgi:hypothetical protein
MNDFNKGIEYAFDYIEKHMYGYVVNGQFKSAVLKEELKNLRKKIPIKCDFCPKPCEQPHCCTIIRSKCKNESNN